VTDSCRILHNGSRRGDRVTSEIKEKSCVRCVFFFVSFIVCIFFGKELQNVVE